MLCLRTNEFYSGPLIKAFSSSDKRFYDDDAKVSKTILNPGVRSNIQMGWEEQHAELRYHHTPLSSHMQTWFTDLRKVLNSESKSLRDLGMSSGALFQVHITNLVIECRRIAGRIKAREKETMRIIMRPQPLWQLAPNKTNTHYKVNGSTWSNPTNLRKEHRPNVTYQLLEKTARIKTLL